MLTSVISPRDSFTYEGALALAKYIVAGALTDEKELLKTMSKLHMEAEQTARATPDVLWALVSDANQYPTWGPWSAAGYRRPGDTSPRPQMMADLVAAERQGAGGQ